MRGYTILKVSAALTGGKESGWGCEEVGQEVTRRQVDVVRQLHQGKDAKEHGRMGRRGGQEKALNIRRTWTWYELLKHIWTILGDWSSQSTEHPPRLFQLLSIPIKREQRHIPPILIQSKTFQDIPRLLPILLQKLDSLINILHQSTGRYREPKLFH